MNYISLFSGAEGGGLAFQHLIKPKITCIGYVENDDYCQRIIRQRQIDGLLDKAPIYGDIRTFIDSGCAALYQGITDVITAGFPCQPFSIAGKQLAEKDNRNMWPETIETIRIVRPATVFLENVPGLLANEYALTIFRQLRENGYETLPPLKLGADDIGANHKRKRIWSISYSDKQYGNDRGFCSSEISQLKASRIQEGETNVADTNWNGTQRDKSENRQRFGVVENGQNVSDTTRAGLSLTPGTGETKFTELAQCDWWDAEPALG